MLPKFETKTYWKHDDCLDVFIYVYAIEFDDGEIAKLRISWLTQGSEIYFYNSSSESVLINSLNYSKWKPYTPKGKLKL